MSQRLTLPAFALTFLLGCGQLPDEPNHRQLTTAPSAALSTATPPQAVVLQPNGVVGQDVWITSVFSHGDDYGVDDEKLEVGGWGDLYHSLIRFDLAALPRQAASATVVLQPFPRGDVSTSVSMTLHLT
jgi:hypothetical protein